MIKGDPNMMHTVIHNILLNAIKFTPRYGNITIGAIHDKETTELYFKDTGVGISPENLGNILKLESKYSTNGTEGEKGTGLGIILIKEMIEKQGGKIRITSEEHVGTTVSLIFTTLHPPILPEN